MNSGAYNSDDGLLSPPYSEACMPAPNSPCHVVCGQYILVPWLPERIWWCHLSAGNPLRACYYSTYCKYCTYCICLWPSSSTHRLTSFLAAPSTLIFCVCLYPRTLEWSLLSLLQVPGQRSLSHRRPPWPPCLSTFLPLSMSATCWLPWYVLQFSVSVISGLNPLSSQAWTVLALLHFCPPHCSRVNFKNRNGLS